ncbi:MAG: TRAP transporter TatT component family protein [Nitrospinota bacterium]
MKRTALLSSILALALFAVGCTLKQVVARSSAALLDDMIAALNAETDTGHAREAAASLLVMLEGHVRADPGYRPLRRAAAQAYGGFAFGFLENEEPERARRLYKRGRDHGLRALGLSPAAQPDAAFRRAVVRLGRDDLPLLFWTAYCWSGWINLSRGNPDALADLPRAEAMMARARAIDPQFFHGGPELFFGVYYGSRSRLLGGDPQKAAAHFRRAIAATGGRFLMAKFLFARYHAVQTQDKALFVRLLDEIEKAPAGLLPDQALANALAKERARDLRERMEELF